MNASLPADPRSEPLLWLQLLGVGALPLQGLLIFLLLAGSDPGPWPWLERGLAWALGGLAPAVLLWSRPADVWSLLLISTPLRGRRDVQRRLSSLQQGLGLQLVLVLGAAALLPLLVWLDRWSVLASAHALLPEAPRLVALLLSTTVLALMLWQWQQLWQCLWLLSRPAAAVAAATALTADETGQVRLCLGLPLLLPDPLRFADPGRPRPGRTVVGKAWPQETATAAAAERPVSADAARPIAGPPSPTPKAAPSPESWPDSAADGPEPSGTEPSGADPIPADTGDSNAAVLDPPFTPEPPGAGPEQPPPATRGPSEPASDLTAGSSLDETGLASDEAIPIQHEEPGEVAEAPPSAAGAEAGTAADTEPHNQPSEASQEQA